MRIGTVRPPTAIRKSRRSERPAAEIRFPGGRLHLIFCLDTTHPLLLLARMVQAHVV
jgi:hypothetical protein